MKGVFAMRRSILAKLLIALVMVLSFAAVGAAAPVPNVILNGTVMHFEVPPSIDGGTTFVPLRAIFEPLGATVNWDAATNTVNASKGDTTMVLTIGKKTATVNGKDVALTAAAKVVNNRTLVPLRFVSESLGANVAWNAATSTVTITTAPPATATTAEETPAPAISTAEQPSAPPVPSGFTGDKAAAYSMLVAAIPSINTAEANYSVVLKVSTGDVNVSAPACSVNYQAARTSGKIDMGELGTKDLDCAFAPFSELTSGAGIESLLENARVAVQDGVISVGGSTAPQSVIDLFNQIQPDTVTFTGLKIDYQILVQDNKITEIKGISGTGNAELLFGDTPVEVTGSMILR
jgi:hypothetical protein